MDDVTGRYATLYDNVNRPIENQLPNSNTITLTYDKLGQRNTMTVPGGRRVTYTHDSLRQLTE